MLNTFFGILESEEPAVADRFIKDRATWSEFNRMALTAASKNPALLWWIWQLAGTQDLLRWLGSYLNYTLQTFLLWLFSWFPGWLNQNRGWVEKTHPALCFWMLAQSYHLTYGMGSPPDQPQTVKVQPPALPEKPSQQVRRPPQAVAPAANRSPVPQSDASSSLDPEQSLTP